MYKVLKKAYAVYTKNGEEGGNPLFGRFQRMVGEIPVDNGGYQRATYRPWSNAEATHPRLFARPARPFGTLPDYTRHNWGDPARVAGAPRGTDRPAWMDWWRNPNSGNLRITEVPWVPIPNKHIPHKYLQDDFD